MRKDVDVHCFFVEIKNVENEIKEFKNTLKLKSPKEIYFSRHFTERLIERKLVKDLKFVEAVVKWFHAEVFKKTTFSERTYKICFKGLKIILRIANGILTDQDERHLIVKSVYEHGQDEYFDEEIIL